MIGKTVSHYKILEKIGQGGMGAVYKAEDTKLKRIVALKFLLPHILSSEEEKSRFTHEAQAAAALQHPNICTIHEINEADGQTFISMAYLEGRSLNERIERGPLKPVEGLRIALQVARGLQAAHEKGIIHRDIKSSNIMVSNDGRATILDFGLAKSVHQTHVTKRGTTMGTIAYMSPEQTRGDPVDHRTDIWSLGVLLYEMVTGRRPFRGDYDEAVVYSILNEEPEPVTSYAPAVWEDIWLAIQRAIAKRPEDRYQTTAEMVEDLEILCDDLRTGSSTRHRHLHASKIDRHREPFARAFFSRHAFTVTVLYVIAAWFVVKGADWAEARFLWSPHLSSMTLIALLSLIPTVWILAARHGTRTRVWSMITKIVIPANVIASVVLVFALFAGRDLGAATETVTVVDEAGRTIERAIPKSEFRKSLLLYFLDNNTGDESLDWIGGAVPVLLRVDMFQDEFLYVRWNIDDPFRRRLQEAGYPAGFDVPWNLKRRIAEEAHIDYLVTGSYALEDSTWAIELLIHESRSGRLVSSRVHTDTDLFALVDRASLEARRDIGLPEGHIETTQDLPVAEIFTASMPALRDLCIGVYVALFNQDWAGGVDYLERAVAADSTFSWGHFTLWQFYQANNMQDKTDSAMRAAMQHSYKLPERMRFLLKSAYYDHMQDSGKRLAVLQMMVELYPDDIEARGILSYVRLQRNERDLAIAQCEKIIQIDPSRTEFLQGIGNMYMNMAEFDKAVEYYESYLKEYPDDAEGHHGLGAVYEVQGDYQDAKMQYERALVIDPNRVPALADIADIEGKLGNDQEATEKFKEALALAKTPEHRARVHRSEVEFYSLRGQMDKSLEQLRLLWAEQEKYQVPIATHMETLERLDLDLFVRAGRPQEALEILDTIETQLGPPWEGHILLGYSSLYVELGETGKAKESLEQLKDAIVARDTGHLRGEAYRVEGRLEEALGNYEAAIRLHEHHLDEDPRLVTPYLFIGRCYRKLGEYEAAVSALEKMLRVLPHRADANFEIALAYHGMGNRAKAMEHLQRALGRWASADPGFEPAKEARATLAEWQR